MLDDSPKTTPTDPSLRTPDGTLGFKLEVLEGTDVGKVWESKTDSCSIGSHPRCDLPLTDPTVSRFHCEIVTGEQALRLRDSGSMNGTILDGVKIQEAFLSNQSMIRIGRSVLRFSYLNSRTPIPLSPNTQFGTLTGRSVAMRQVFALLELAAAKDDTIFLDGETGTGKSAAAHAIHQTSTRAGKPFILADCSAVHPEMLASDLFGHEQGAFTGAHKQRIGKFEAASGGTIFFDEIGELPHELQAKLLGVIDNKRICRLGSTNQRSVDVRIIAATNRDLRREVNNRTFREDLYYRMAVIRILMPPLRRRLEDIPLLAEHILLDRGVPREQIASILTPEHLQRLQRSAWPGNIRELRNHLDRVLFHGDWTASEEELVDAEEAQPKPDTTIPWEKARKQQNDKFAKAYFQELLRQHDGNVARAAAAAQVTSTYLHRLKKRLGID